MIVDYEHVVGQPLDQVFAVMADIGRRPEWVSIAAERTRVTKGPVGVGTRYRAEDRYLGRRVEFVQEINAYERNQLLAESWSGPLAGQITTRFTKDNGSTRLTIRTTIEPPGVLKLLSPLLKVWLLRVFARDYVRFERLVAAESAHIDNPASGSENGRN